MKGLVPPRSSTLGSCKSINLVSFDLSNRHSFPRPSRPRASSQSDPSPIPIELLVLLNVEGSPVSLVVVSFLFAGDTMRPHIRLLVASGLMASPSMVHLSNMVHNEIFCSPTDHATIIVTVENGGDLTVYHFLV
jgi:hypothetical protein